MATYTKGEWAIIEGDVPHAVSGEHSHKGHIGIYTETSDIPLFFCLNCLKEVNEGSFFTSLTPKFNNISDIFEETC